MDDLTQRVRTFLDAYAGDAPTPESVVEIVGDLENDRRRLLTENARLRKLYHLAARDVIFFSTYDEDTNSWPDCGEFFMPVVNVNDTFAYATADAQRITDDQIDVLIRLERRFGNDGVVAWAAAVRGCEPLEPYLTEKYRLARAAFSAEPKL